MQKSVLDSPETKPPYPERLSQIPKERSPVVRQLPIFDFTMPSTSKSASEEQRKSCPEVSSSTFETSAINFQTNSHLLGNPYSKRCSSLVPGGNLRLPSTCSLSPICRGSSTASECEVGFDLEDTVFLSPRKSARVFAPSTVREESSLLAREATFTIHHHPSTSTPSRLLCLFSWVLALPLLTLGVTFALDLPSIATDSLTAAIFLSVLVLVAALLSAYVRFYLHLIKIDVDLLSVLRIAR